MAELLLFQLHGPLASWGEPAALAVRRARRASRHCRGDTAMYLTRLTLLDHPDIGAVLWRLGDACGEHQRLWQLFDPDPDGRRDFLYRRDSHRGRPRYFVLSRRPPVNPLGLWAIDPPKPFAPKLHPGQRLAFMVRVNPVVSRDGRRHDVVMDYKKRLGWKDLPKNERPPLPEVIHDAGLEWLRRQGERHGFVVGEKAIRIEGYRQHRNQGGSASVSSIAPACSR